MILAIDVGNTSIVLGCVEKGEVLSTARLSSDVHKTEHEYAYAMREVLSAQGVDCTALEGAIISSVVWPLTDVMQEAVRILTGKSIRRKRRAMLSTRVFCL